MSLFKVRDFWSIDLEQLQYHIDATSQDQGQAVRADQVQASNDGSYVIDLGQFSSIGGQDVFVCANINGFICIIQVPKAKQLKLNTRNVGLAPSEHQQTNENSDSLDRSGSPHVDFSDRQLLASCQLSLPIVDLKCGYFNSVIKQSIAVLSFDKLIIFQVKKRQIDLLSSSFDFQQSTNFESQTINESLLSHEIEEHYRLDLLVDEFASNILVLNSHADSCLAHQNGDKINLIANDKDVTTGLSQRSKQIVQQLHLPQRDKIVIQYTNQFIFTLVDNKKITGHFYMRSNRMDNENSIESQRIQQMYHFVGSMPMAYLYDIKSSSLVVSFTNYRICCLSLDKLINQAKQNIMKRVAQDLLHDRTNQSSPSSQAPTTTTNGKPSLSYLNKEKINDQLVKVWIDLEPSVEWDFELVAAPIQMIGIQRYARDVMSPSHQDYVAVSQLLVMSRYNLTLFSSSGQQLWSQRFETPLMHIYPYTVELAPTSRPNNDDKVEINTNEHRIQSTDRLISLVCTDSLSDDKSNLLVLEENRVAWSALLNSKPVQLMRTNLNKMSGFLASLDIKQGQLTVSYLGTNIDTNQNDTGSDTSETDDIYLSKMELYDEPTLSDEKFKSKSIDGENYDFNCRLLVDTRLEAKNNWPDVCVDCCLSIRLDPDSTSVLHNIIATLEFDDLLRFESSERPVTAISKGVVQVQLGNCWPDRREPILLKGTFNLLASRSSGVGAIDKVEIGYQQEPFYPGLMPKTLEVKLYFRYNETLSGVMLQEESFLLPLNMISRLIHIDFSSGQDQDLSDVLGNLNPYKRVGAVSNVSPPYYLCDLFLKVNGDILDVIDDIIEGDLVCRGLDSGCLDGQKHTEKDRKLMTLENISLLAQSLDCRLRYKNPTSLTRQYSEEFISPVITSIALKVSHVSNALKDHLKVAGDSVEQNTILDAIVWIHVCDLSATGSSIPEEMVKMHIHEWKKYSSVHPRSEKLITKDHLGQDRAHSVLLSIECDQPLPVLLFQSHLIRRLRGRALNRKFDLELMAVVANNISVDFNHETLLNIGSFTAISSNLHDSLKATLDNYNSALKLEFKQFKDELAREYCKFNIATTTSLSLAKRLSSLPDTMSLQYKNLTTLTKQYQLNLMKILNELERLKKLDYEFSKIPRASNIKIEVTDGRSYMEWPDFQETID